MMVRSTRTNPNIRCRYAANSFRLFATMSGSYARFVRDSNEPLPQRRLCDSNHIEAPSEVERRHDDRRRLLNLHLSRSAVRCWPELDPGSPSRARRFLIPVALNVR